MSGLRKVRVSTGIFWVEVPEANLYMICGAPADGLKHLTKKGFILPEEEYGIKYETGPNAILLSDILIQNGAFSNLSEFPVLQMLYKQGMIIPQHPNNTGSKPLLIGSRVQIDSQMKYIYRGNYGLTSMDELMEAGITREMASEIMSMKLRFAFGKIRETDEFLDSIVVADESVEIRNGVYIQRLHLNIFEIRYRNQSVTVDLNLRPMESYEPSYSLGFHNVRREYFGVVHSGDGDGWDDRRPTMSGILMFQGKNYLIDAGPHILHTLKALSISVNGIEGIFHTHSHDDHFCGLPALMRSDRQIKYYSTPMVISSVRKKLAALLSSEEDDFSNYFEVHELNPEVWNDVDGFEVKPMFSPHPVETSIFLFRAMSGEGYKTYAHFADIIGLDTLRGMIGESDSQPGISREMYDRTVSRYLEKADLKRIDIGGGMIHGSVEDFKNDESGKIILAHTSEDLTYRQKEIGSGAPFGMVDVLVHSRKDYLRDYALELLQSHFPSVARHQLELIGNCPIVTFNPESILLKSGVVNTSLYLILSGQVEMINSGMGIHNILSAGALAGEISALNGLPSPETYSAANFVTALELPFELYLYFIRKNGLHDEIVKLLEKRKFLQETRLFGDAVSYPLQNRIARMTEEYCLPAYRQGMSGGVRELYVVRSGKVLLHLQNDLLETLGNGDFWGEGCVLFNTPCLFEVKCSEGTRLYKIPGDELLNIPSIRWKLLEVYQRRMEMMFNPGMITRPIFEWRDEYGTNIKEIDEEHKELLGKINNVYHAIAIRKDYGTLQEAIESLIGFSRKHFQHEQRLMQENEFPDFEWHRKKHEKFMEDVANLRKEISTNGMKKHNAELVNFFKDWIINHILTADRKYGPFLNQKGIH
jgi:hemerythrin